MVKYIFNVYINWDTKDYNLSAEWVRDRIKLFHDFTLSSILNQSVDDFDVWALCGNNNVDVTKSYKWNDRITVVYDKGKSLLKKYNYDYIVLIRIDSDDLYHADALLDIKNNVMLTNEMEYMIFRSGIAWNRPNNYIIKYIRHSPPFFVHIYPKKLYKDFDYFCKTHYVSHGRAGGRLARTKELSENKFCVVKHWTNVTEMLGSKNSCNMTSDRARKIVGNNFITDDTSEIVSILKEFGINEEKIKIR